MARRTNKVYTEVKNWKIYVILFPGQNEFYIGLSSQKDLRTTFKDHYNLRLNRTKLYVQKLKEKDILPQMYLLEIFEGTKNNAFSRIVAWAKLLSKSGYICVNGDTFEAYTEDLIPLSLSFYEEISNTEITALLAENNSLFPDYRPIKKDKRKKNKAVVHLSFSPEEDEIVEKQAKELSKSKTAYCKQMALTGEIYTLNNFANSEYLRELREGIATMQQAIITIHRLGQYFPSDLEKIENFKNTVEEHYIKLVKESTKINNKISKLNEVD